MTIAEQIAEKEAARDRLNEEIEELKAQREPYKYPYAGIGSFPTVVVFSSPKTGTAISKPDFNPFGETCNYWAEKDFHRFTGTIRFVDGQPVETKED